MRLIHGNLAMNQGMARPAHDVVRAAQERSGLSAPESMNAMSCSHCATSSACLPSAPRGAAVVTAWAGDWSASDTKDPSVKPRLMPRLSPPVYELPVYVPVYPVSVSNVPLPDGELPLDVRPDTALT